MVLATFLLLIPFVWWASQERHTIGSRAGLEPTLFPTPIIYGSLPAVSPVIREVLPFFGKVGDQLVVRGENFGVNPPSSEIFLGAAKVTEIESWESEEIVFTIPEGALSGNLKLVVGPYQQEWNRPLTVYDSQTRAQVSLLGGHLGVLNPQSVAQAAVWADGAGEPAVLLLNNPSVDSWQSRERYSQIDWVVLYDAAGGVIPFFVDPLEML